MIDAALAIFVKTPGLSALKTRLAADIGSAQAECFHTLSASAVAEVARAAMPTLTPYWAVAEHEALEHPLWQEFSTLWQGRGGLGARMDSVYRELLSRHARVLLIGADAPQLRVQHLHDAVRALDDPSTPFVLGPARDGGFWLFGGREPVPGEVWRTPHYSTAGVARELCTALRPLGAIATLPELTDADTVDDFPALIAALDGLDDPLPAQRRLRSWLHALQPSLQAREQIRDLVQPAPTRLGD